MNEFDTRLSVWMPPDTPAATSAKSPQEIAEFARPHLSARDIKSIVAAIQSESYEMASTFVWSKASAVLKKQLATLGMDFVGEMLGRQDITVDSDPSISIADHEAISLAEDLGLISTTQGLRLKHSLELVTHFTNLDQAHAEIEAMNPEEATSVLRTCVNSILSRPSFEGAIKFADFRKALGERTLKPEDGDIQNLAVAPYFFLRTTLSVIISLAKSGKGVTQEHALGNFAVLISIIWPKLRDPERWQVGQAYAEVNLNGDRRASASLKHGLLKVHGFDYVPENLRSSTYAEAAARVLAAHFGYNNFFAEQEPTESLATLGTAIPKPAFAKCMEAILAVWLGNPWGHSFKAEPAVVGLLNSLRAEQWAYYLNECLRRDRTVLDKLATSPLPLNRWIELVERYTLGTVVIRHKEVADLISASVMKQNKKVKDLANKVRLAATS